jgi:hypothetical protein
MIFPVAVRGIRRSLAVGYDTMGTVAKLTEPAIPNKKPGLLSRVETIGMRNHVSAMKI